MIIMLELSLDALLSSSTLAPVLLDKPDPKLLRAGSVYLLTKDRQLLNELRSNEVLQVEGLVPFFLRE